MFSVDSFSEDQFEFYPLTGLTCSSDRNAPDGSICFCKTRAGNLTFWKWYLTELVIPETQHCRKRSFEPPKLPDDSLMPVFIMIDGEAVDVEILKLLEDNLIIIGKLQASCSLTYPL